MAQLNTVKVIRCDAVAMRIFGLSLAAWNALIAASLVVFGAMSLRQWRQEQADQGSSSLSQ